VEQASDSTGHESSIGKLAKVHFALRRLGFSDAEARRAVAEVPGLADSSLEEILRCALLAATRAA
jgi:Holliday junction resolvasome RuvABC DNA-binding subunit